MRNLLSLRSAVVTVALTGFAGAVLAAPGLARAEVVAYSGSAGASAVQMTFRSPGFPVSDVPLDGGGPTALAILDNAGTSQAHALFPNPGPLVVGGAGTVAGLVGAGAGGLPPIALPPIPPYPFQAQSDVSLVPEAKAGEGPYSLRAASSDTTSAASAHVGGYSETVGRVLFANADSEVAQEADGGVIAKGTSGAQGIAIGPLTVGEIATTAAAVADETGYVTTKTTALIAGMKIGGQPVAVDGAGLNAGGVPIPLPISERLKQVLAASGITVTLVPAQRSEDGAIAPAMVISMPADLRPIGLGTAPGTMTITLGASSARLTTAGSNAGAGLAPLGAAGGAGQLPAVDAAGLPGLETAGIPGTLPGTVPGGVAPGTGIPTASLVPTAASALDTATFDITSVYVFIAAGALVALILAQMTGLLGVRRPWTSDAG